MNCKSNFRNLCQKEFDGAECCILGAGPSLSNASADFICSMPCFAVNSAILYVKWLNGEGKNRFWVSNDSLCLRWNYWDIVKKSNCNIVVRDSWCKYQSILPENYHMFYPRKKNYDFEYSISDELCFCSSVPTCIDMAIGFGFKKIYIFGVDHNESNCGYFWSTWKDSDKPKQVIDFQGARNFFTKPLALQQPIDQRLEVWRENMKCFSFLNDVAKQRGITIVNMNPESKVKNFRYEHM